MRTFISLAFALWLLVGTSSGLRAQTLNAVDDYYTTISGLPFIMPVLSNDYSMTGYFGEVLVTTPPLSGATVTALTSGELIYLPADGFIGADVFTYTVSNDLGATATATVYVEVLAGCPDLFAVITTPTPTLCSGNCSGIAILSVWGGTPPYTIEWNTGATAYVQDNLCPGAYTVFVTDATGCSTVSNIYLTEAEPLLVSTTVNPAIIGPGGIALLQANVSGGTPPYTYQWNPNTAITNTTAANPIASPTATTTYVVTVTDNLGCTGFSFAIVLVDGSVGAIIANDDFYETPSSGPLTLDILANDVFTGDLAPTITSSPNNGSAVVAGSYIMYIPNPGFSGYDTLTYIICNSFSVCSTATVVIWVNTGGSGCTGFAAFANIPNYVLCPGACNGFGVVSTWGGTPPYNFLWSNGVTNAVIENLCAGAYSLTITDASGCTLVQNHTFTEAPPLVATAVAMPATIAPGQTTQISATASGGTPPYNYQWIPATGLSNPTIPNPLAAPMATTTYLLTVTDALGCTAQYPLVVLVSGSGCDLTPFVNVTMPVCFDACSGSLAASVMGGTPPYTYQWTGPGGFISTANPVTGLCPGVYTLIVADAMGCILNQPYTIAATNPPLAVVAFTDTPTIPVGGTATITALATGGTSPYFYMWNTGQIGANITVSAAGNYCVTVTDANGCIDEDCRTIFTDTPATVEAVNDWVYAEPEQPITIAPLTNDSGTGALNLLSAVSALSITIDYDNDWITLTAPALPGTYTISYIITDATGATATGVITLVVVPPGECADNCVWPGDANNDGITNNYDVLNIGLAFNFTGTPRADQSTNWYAHAADNWADSFAGGLNFKFADCNGSGTVNAQDTTAISLNYGLTHGKTQTQAEDGAPLFYSIQAQTGTGVGDTIALWIELGNNANPVTDFYGIAYTLNYDGTFLQLAHLTLPDGSWVGNAANTLLYKKTTGSSQTDAALTRTNQTNVSGQGIIGKASFVIIENIDGKNEESLSYNLNFSFTNVRCITNAENEIPIQPQNFVLTNTAQTTPAQNSHSVRVYPNPVKDQLYLNAQPGACIQIYNPVGQLLYQTCLPNNTATLTLPTHTWTQGLYLVVVDTPQNREVVKMLKQ